MSYCGFITKLENVRKHPNADRLVLADVLGATVIVNNDAKEGDIVAYFPSDGQLSEEFCAEHDLVRRKDKEGNQCGGFLDPQKRNVRILKLRGVASDGLCMPIASLEYTGVDISSLSIGDTITTVSGHEICRKYISPLKPSKPQPPSGKLGRARREAKETTPYFVEHLDTPQLRFVMNRFKAGDVISLTEKVHGTSSRNANSLVVSHKQTFFDRILHKKGREVCEYKYLVGTRRTTVTDKEGGYYDSNQFRIDWGEQFKGKLHPGECAFGEIAGYVDNTSTPIMSVADNRKTQDKEFIKQYGNTTTFTYGCSVGQSRYFIYRMTYTSPEGYVIEYPWDMVVRRAKEMGFEVVPELDRFIYTTEKDFMERINKWMDVPSTIDPSHVIEGVVVRAINDPNLRIAKAKSTNFKIIEGIMKAEATAPDIEEAEDAIIEI